MRQMRLSGVYDQNGGNTQATIGDSEPLGAGGGVGGGAGSCEVG